MSVGSVTGAPKVTLLELDISDGIASSYGAYCGMVIPAPRGPVGTGILITNEQQLLNVYTPLGTILPSYDSSFFVAIRNLRKCNKLWVSRCAPNSLLGGAFVRVAGAVAAGAINAFGPAERGFADPLHYDITSTDGRTNPGPVIFTADGEPGVFTVDAAFYAAMATGDVTTITAITTVPLPLVTATTYYAIKSATPNKVALATTSQLAFGGSAIAVTSAGIGLLTLHIAAKTLNSVTCTVDFATDSLTVTSAMYTLLKTGDTGTVAPVSSGGVLPTPLVAATPYFVYITPVLNKIGLATSLINAQNGVTIDLSDTGTGVQEIVFASITATAGGQDKALLLYGADAGLYNNNLSFTLTNYATNPALVKEPGAFLIQLFYNGIALQRETWTCAFDPAHQNGRYQSIYIVDVLARSAYIRATVNPLLSTTGTFVADVLVPQPFNGGFDGTAITDGAMVTALNVMAVTDKYPLSFLQDSGWATPTYHNALIQFVENRGSAVALLAPPYQVEATTNALNDVISYAQSLNSQSSHAGIFTSHVQVLDSYNNRNLWLSPVGDVAAEYAEKFDRFSPGQPVGGKFGTLSVLDVARHWQDGEMDLLYSNNVNPIRSKLGKGIQIWGQKTLQTRPSDLDRLNARMVLMAIEPPLRDAYENYLFTKAGITNDSGTRRSLTLVTDNFMATVKAQGGVYDWKTICSDVNNTLLDVQNETVNIWLLVKIIKAVEYIPFTLAVAPLSISFNVAQSLITG